MQIISLAAVSEKNVAEKKVSTAVTGKNSQPSLASP